MKFVTIRELNINSSRVIDSLEDEGAIITKHGKPVAALISLNEDLLDDFIVTHNSKLLSELDRSHKEYKEKGGTAHETMKKKTSNRRD